MVNYNCCKCGKFFKQKAQWKYHMENKKFPCDINQQKNYEILRGIIEKSGGNEKILNKKHNGSIIWKIKNSHVILINKKIMKF